MVADSDEFRGYNRVRHTNATWREQAFGNARCFNASFEIWEDSRFLDFENLGNTGGCATEHSTMYVV